MAQRKADYANEHCATERNYAAHSLVPSSTATAFASREAPSLLIPSRPSFSPIPPRTPDKKREDSAPKKPASRPPSPPTPANPFASQRTLQRTPQEPLDLPAPKKPPQRPPSPKPSTNPFVPRRTLWPSPGRPTQSPPEPPTTATPPESPPKRAEDRPLGQRTTENNARTDTQKKPPSRPPPPRSPPKTATPPHTIEKPQFTPPKEDQVRRLIEQANHPEEQHQLSSDTIPKDSEKTTKNPETFSEGKVGADSQQ
ncbi:hypothetical protein QR680_013326 [Steinernema hermaphroditum]|uniref:Uncharacterized protein n=1 Tax=Steinernema hermaphroditum TaxID=289476 RepID=A0AA39I7X8_9BILA|nr:hypothetical protein QR680_013326 [Steinernema hermaphroditum]